MIYTVTCNPSLDYRMELGQLKPGETNRADAVGILAGGKGLNVSVVLHHLGMDTTALGFVAGFVGDEIELRMEKSGCHCRFIHLEDGCSRINVKLRGTDETTELNAPGPDISAAAQDELLRQLTEMAAGDVLILAGSVPLFLFSTDEVCQNCRSFCRRIGRNLKNNYLCRELEYYASENRLKTNYKLWHYNVVSSVCQTWENRHFSTAYQTQKPRRPTSRSAPSSPMWA